MPATSVNVLRDLRELIEVRRQAAPGPSSMLQAAHAPRSSGLASAREQFERRQASGPTGITAALNALADMETSSPSDTLSPCSEVLLRRRFRAGSRSVSYEGKLEDHDLKPLSQLGALEHGLTSVSLPPSPPRARSIEAPSELPSISTVCLGPSTGGGQEAEQMIRSPLAAFGTASQSNTPRAKGGKSFGKGKIAEAPPSPALIHIATPRPKLKPTHEVAVGARTHGEGQTSGWDAGEDEDAVEDKENALGEHTNGLSEKQRRCALFSRACLPREDLCLMGSRLACSVHRWRLFLRRLAGAEKDGTVFRLLLGECESALPEVFSGEECDDDFFVLPDEPAKPELSAPLVDSARSWSKVEAAAHFLAANCLPTAVAAASIAVVVGMSISARRR